MKDILTNTVSNIMEAIDENKCIEFDYKEEGKREGQPHALYRNKKGETMIDCFQTCGHSTTEQKSGWKQFKLDSITDCIVLSDVPFVTHVQFNPNSKRYASTIIRVEKP